MMTRSLLQTTAPSTPNPFFGPRIIKKNTPVHVKDDFNPFKHNKVAEATSVGAYLPAFHFAGTLTG